MTPGFVETSAAGPLVEKRRDIWAAAGAVPTTTPSTPTAIRMRPSPEARRRAAMAFAPIRIPRRR